MNTALPGPYEAHGNKVKGIDHGHRYTLADCRNPKLTPHAQHDHARLFAAAPELLQACQDMLAVGMSVRAESIIWTDLRAAITKATGA